VGWSKLGAKYFTSLSLAYATTIKGIGQENILLLESKAIKKNVFLQIFIQIQSQELKEK